MTGLQRTLGNAECPVCGQHKGVVLKVNRKGHLYIYCPTPGDGGCGCGVTSRYSKGDALLAEKYCRKWDKAEDRKSFGGGGDVADPKPDDPGDDELVVVEIE